MSTAANSADSSAANRAESLSLEQQGDSLSGFLGCASHSWKKPVGSAELPTANGLPRSLGPCADADAVSPPSAPIKEASLPPSTTANQKPGERIPFQANAFSQFFGDDDAMAHPATKTLSSGFLGCDSHSGKKPTLLPEQVPPPPAPHAAPRPKKARTGASPAENGSRRDAQPYVQR